MRRVWPFWAIDKLRLERRRRADEYMRVLGYQRDDNGNYQRIDED